MAPSSLQVLPCPLDDRGRALELLYRGLERRVRDALVEQAIEDDDQGIVDLSGLWIARKPGWTSPGRLVGALLTQQLPGRAAAVWAPQVAGVWNRAEVAAALVARTLDGLRADGVAIAQAVLDSTADPQGGRDLAQGGMPRITELIYLRRSTATPCVPNRSASTLQWRGADELGSPTLRDALAATYVGSLDVPEIEGARCIDEVLEGHRGAEGHRPERWRLGRVEGEPDALAVLLLAAPPTRDAWEVVYLGLTPPARGRGLGEQAVAHALESARPNVSAIELAVDARNHPAVKLYQKTGFAPYDRRAVHLAVLSRREPEDQAGRPPLR